MPVLMIGYDLHEEEDYGDLIAAIKDEGAWWHCLDSTWLVQTERSCKAVRNDLLAHLTNPDEKAGDKLLVVRVTGERAWTKSFSKTCQDWLRSHM